MKKKLTDNLLLKIVSVIIAIIIWAVIANMNDPIVSANYNVPVTITNGAYIESIGKTYRVAEEDQEQKVRVTLRGKSSIVENLSIDEIEAIADLTHIVDMNTTPYVVVPITVHYEPVPSENITVTPQSIKIVLEDRASQEFIVGVDVRNKPDSRFAVGETVAQPEKVKITGPASLIRKIDRVVASVDVTGLDEDTTRTSGLVVFDKNEEELLAPAMSSLRFDIGEPEVEVAIELWRIVPEVELKVNHSGSPGAGYHVSDIVSTPTHIGIAGTEEALEELKAKGNVIEIPASEVDILGTTEDVEKKVDLTQFLPADTKIASDVTTAIVTVTILPIGSEAFVLDTQDIKVTGLDAKNVLAYDTEEVTVNISGPDAVLQTIKAETLNATIDLAGLSTGAHKVPIKISIPENSELLEEIIVGIEIKELE